MEKYLKRIYCFVFKVYYISPCKNLWNVSYFLQKKLWNVNLFVENVMESNLFQPNFYNNLLKRKFCRKMFVEPIFYLKFIIFNFFKGNSVEPVEIFLWNEYFFFVEKKLWNVFFSKIFFMEFYFIEPYFFQPNFFK